MTQRQAAVMQALLRTNSKKEAARQTGVSLSTIHGYLRDADFQAAYQAAQRSMLQAACVQSQSMLSDALRTLEEIANDVDTNPQTRCYAARSLLEYGLRLVEAADFDRRLTELEKRDAHEKPVDAA